MGAPMTPALEAKLAVRDFCDFSEVDPLCWQTLQDNGVDFGAVTNIVGPICLRSVTFIDDGGFVYDELGETGFAFVVADVDAETPIDILAFSARDPSMFGTLLRQAALLGADRDLDPASYYGDKPCPLWRSPLRWLQEGCEGAVVLAPIPAATVLARAPGMLAAEDIQHARQLTKSAAIPMHKLVVPVDPVRKAA